MAFSRRRVAPPTPYGTKSPSNIVMSEIDATGGPGAPRQRRTSAHTTGSANQPLCASPTKREYTGQDRSTEERCST